MTTTPMTPDVDGAALVARAFTALSSRLGEVGAAHCAGVADAAERLAEAYGVDLVSARLAGLLHDWCKETPAAELLAFAESEGIEITDVDRKVPYLLHAPVGAAMLRRDLPGLPEEVYDAVAMHTFGGDDMSAVAMVVYVADMIEPHRTFEGVEALRSVAGSVPLEELFAQAYTVSLGHVVATRRRIHPATLSVWNSVVAASRKV